MPNAYVLFWFDVEDCTVPQSDDAAKCIAEILTERGVRGTMKVVGQKARLLRERIRYDVIDALRKHDIGYHSNWHGLRPQVAEYLAPLGWEEGAAEFDRRERQGLDDIEALLGQHPVCYGQPGGNWAPQVFPTLRRWGIPAYISGYGYVGLHCQPFWYGGLLNTSYMYGRREDGSEARLYLGLNFELGTPGALEEHKRKFAQALGALGPDGGLITVMNHPCTLVLEEWFSTTLKPRHATEAGYRDFDAFVRDALGMPEVAATDARELLALYADEARDREFTRDELLALARSVEGEVTWRQLDSVVVSAAELFGLFVCFLANAEAPPERVVWAYLDGPATRLEAADTDFSVPWPQFVKGATKAAAFCAEHGRVPDDIALDGKRVFPGDFLATAAEAVATLIATGRPPERVTVLPARHTAEGYVDEEAARSSWKGSMAPADFRAPGLIELAKLQTWTLKPAVLKPR